MGLKISTDIGGTFTDIVIVDDDGTVNIFKSPTTPTNRVKGVINGLENAARYYNKTLQELMDDCSFISHGSTVSTNALIEGKTAKTGLICTKGHRDVLLFREGGKSHPFEWYIDYPEPYVPRNLTLSVNERVNAEGDVITSLDTSEVEEIIEEFKSLDVEVIAVSLLWSFINPVHELKIKEIIHEKWPEVEVTLSHIVNPRIREYRRTVSTVIDASLKPLNIKYINSLQQTLKDAGYKKEVYLYTASGGLILPKDMIKRPIFSIDSGPSLAPIAGKYYAQKELDFNNVITCDMGGTSFDIGRITDGEIITTNNAKIGNEKLSIPKADVKAIGAGGGSIAWVDEGGLIRIGPEGAGSDPGPACYIRGGTKATVTDAALLLGYLNEDYFLGGEMTVSKELAEKAVQSNVADPLGMGLLDAAYAIWNTATAKMTEAIRDVTVWEGIDPKNYIIAAGGGAVGLHILPIASQLGVKNVILPKTAAALSAFGGTVADIVREFERTYLTNTQDFNYEQVNNILKDLLADGNDFLNQVGVSDQDKKFEYILEARYPFQEQELTLNLTMDQFKNEDDLRKLENDFHEFHDAVLGSKNPEENIECIVWKVRAIGLTAEKGLEKQAKEKSTEAKPIEFRKAYFRELGNPIDTPIYKGEKLHYGHVISGPAIIEEPTTNLVVFPNETVRVSEHGSYIAELNNKLVTNNRKLVSQTKI